MPKGDQKGDITKSLPATPGATWNDVSVPTPAGQTTTLKRIRIDMAQVMAQLPEAAKAAVAKGGGGNLDNLMDMYVIDAGSSAVLVNWIVPKGQAQKYNLEKAIEASMGTIEVTVPPDAGGKGAKGPAAGKTPPTGCM